MGGRRFTVRYIGIDAPESVQPGTPVQCFAREATTFNRRLVQGRRVRLERDVNDTDRFSRLLRYVYLQDGRMVNEELVSGGYAYASSYPPDVRYQDRLTIAQRTAANVSAGMWKACPTPTTSTLPGVQVAPTTLPPAGIAGDATPATNCDPSYPSLCIPIGAPDLDCPDIPHRRFEVRPPDPHRFDGDHDGVGCER
jgi:micrococcal nuclease